MIDIIHVSFLLQLIMMKKGDSNANDDKDQDDGSNDITSNGFIVTNMMILVKELL